MSGQGSLKASMTTMLTGKAENLLQPAMCHQHADGEATAVDTSRKADLLHAGNAVSQGHHLCGGLLLVHAIVRRCGGALSPALQGPKLPSQLLQQGMYASNLCLPARQAGPQVSIVLHHTMRLGSEQHPISSKGPASSSSWPSSEHCTARHHAL